MDVDDSRHQDPLQTVGVGNSLGYPPARIIDGHLYRGVFLLRPHPYGWYPLSGFCLRWNFAVDFIFDFYQFRGSQPGQQHEPDHQDLFP